MQTLESLTTELERLMGEIPVEVAHDAGATSELLTAAKRAGANATDTWQAHGEKRVTVASAYDTRNDDPRVPTTAKEAGAPREGREARGAPGGSRGTHNVVIE